MCFEDLTYLVYTIREQEWHGGSYTMPRVVGPSKKNMRE